MIEERRISSVTLVFDKTYAVFPKIRIGNINPGNPGNFSFFNDASITKYWNLKIIELKPKLLFKSPTLLIVLSPNSMVLNQNLTI